MSGGGCGGGGCDCCSTKPEGAGWAVAVVRVLLEGQGEEAAATRGFDIVSVFRGGEETGSGGWLDDTGDEDADEHGDELLPVDELRQTSCVGGGGCGLLCSITIDLFKVGLIFSELLFSSVRTIDPPPPLAPLLAAATLPFAADADVEAAAAVGGIGRAIFLFVGGGVAAVAPLVPPVVVASAEEAFSTLSPPPRCFTCFSQAGVTTSGLGQVREGQPAEKCLWQTLM